MVAVRSLFAAGLLVSLVMAGTVRGDGPADNNPQTVRRVPKLGIELDPATRQELLNGVRVLETRVQELGKSKSITAQDRDDVLVFARAVRIAVEHQEFFAPGDVKKAQRLLEAGSQRIRDLEAGRRPWLTDPGLTVRGFRSSLDGSLQPYGLVLPASFHPQHASGYRLDIWLHGRGETLSEVNFLDQRMQQVGRIAPAHTIVLHPYGRYSNAFKFAGETDVFEALQHVRQQYPVDEDRIAMRGFSMGGAGCWQFAVHYPDQFFATTPGAGFSETPEFLKFFQKETLNPQWFEEKLWQMYDCPVYAINLANLPTIAYSGEKDIQKQAADIMETALTDVGIDLVHLIGPDTGHSIHPDSMKEIEARLSQLAALGRDRTPRRVRFATSTLKYNRSHWVVLEGLEEHWMPARVDAEVQTDNAIAVSTRNVTALRLDFPAGHAPLDVTIPVTIRIDGAILSASRPASDRSFTVLLRKQGSRWEIASGFSSELRKRPGLQGPIDDALMSRFVFVRPTRPSRISRTLAKWVDHEMERAVEHWRRHFRGEAIVINDTEVTDELIAGSNLILWGDPTSNAVIGRIAEQLPVKWSATELQVGSTKFEPSDHAPVLVYPNPLNPDRYVVLNSSFTYREYAYLNNARQVPMLPDWAVIDLREPPGTQFPGRVAAAGFFDESWQLKPELNR